MMRMKSGAPLCLGPGTSHETRHVRVTNLRSVDKGEDVHVELIAVLVAVIGGEPSVLTLRDGDRLPSGPLELKHRSLQAGLRAWVERQTGHPVGYIEQLYTFADRDRINGQDRGRRVISISYLGLARAEETAAFGAPGWRPWYGYFPWEDRRAGPAAMEGTDLHPRLARWVEGGCDAETRAGRRQRAASMFGLDGQAWNEEMALQRYELLYEAGLVSEAGPVEAAVAGGDRAMFADHRRILATAIARLRTKIKYRPVVFELMPPVFTLLQLQRAVEALSGRPAHKQNFRRLVEQQELVEETGEVSADTGGRPAKLFRFRPAVLFERTVLGTRLPITRS